MSRDEVIQTLKSHKKIIALYESLLNEYDGFLNAQQISDMPKGSSVSSPIENATHKLNAELKELNKEIRKVNIWLKYLTQEERFVIEQLYFEQRFINQIINRWTSQGYEYHGFTYWKTKHREAIKKITDLRPDSVPIASTF